MLPKRRALLWTVCAFLLCGGPPAASAQSDWKSDWERTLAAAKKEGAVAISASSSELLRKVLMEFERDHPGIRVLYTSANGRDFWSRVEKEREVGRYLWDLRIGGVSTQAYEAKDRGFLDPIRPLLVLPEVTDERNWPGGIHRLFADREKKYAMRFTGALFAGVVVNRDVVPEKDFKTPRDLTDPRWKGKILLQDPRAGGGAGSYALAGFLLQYGEPFVRELLTRQDVVIADNKRQMAEWVIRKRYPIAVGLGTDTLPQFQQQGLGRNVRVVAGDDITGDVVLVLEKAPHPNAAKAYLNWLLSRKTQDRLARVAELNSRRMDVKPGEPASALDLRHIERYLDVSDEEHVEARNTVRKLAKELLR